MNPGRPPARLVVGTGRCGSTLLTRMLDRHPGLVGLHEVFTGLDPARRFHREPVDGAWMVELLGTPNEVIDLVVGRGHDAEEVTYPFRATDRYRRGEPVPWILTSTLGHLDDDPDALWDELAAWLAHRPVATVGDHFRALFEHLAARSGAAGWMERSGSSVDYLGGLLGLFPEARVVHLHRDGPEVALSMRRHPFYRLAVQLLYGITPPGVDPDDRDAVVDGWLEGDPPVALYGRYWSDQLVHGAPALASLPVDRLLTVGFEDVLADPPGVVARIAGFWELPPAEGFAEAAASLVGPPPRHRLGDLPASEQEALVAACAPGREVLARLGAGPGAGT